tara:strand:- start:4113 stop:4829 length:717 start_codon:yes stop_codon:yes gene_type:complete
MKKILIMIVCLGLASCSHGSYDRSNDYIYTYPYDKSLMVEVQTDIKASISVEEFSDYRGNDKKKIKLYNYLPLVPHFYTYRDRPENYYIKDTDSIMYHDLHYNINITKDLSKSTESSLIKSNLFEISNNSDYILKGRILEFKHKKKHYLYGLSGFAPFVQILGAPMWKHKFYLKIEFSLIDRKSHKEVFSKVFSKGDEYKVGLLEGDNCNEIMKSFSKMYQEINNNLIYDLDVLLSKK